MSISREMFEENRFHSDGMDAVLEFLEQNQDKAFKINEIIEHLDKTDRKITDNTVSSYLIRLEKCGFVEHKRPYWAFNRVNEAVEAQADLRRKYGRVVE